MSQSSSSTASILSPDVPSPRREPPSGSSSEHTPAGGRTLVNVKTDYRARASTLAFSNYST